MYKEYFGLKEDPFSIAPDPQFLYLSERHREALAHLLYAIKTDSGFVLLTGEVGTGKTTVCRSLLNQIPDDAEIAFILNPKLSVVELLATVCDELGVAYPAGNTSVKIFVDRLNLFLLDVHARGGKTLLIIDEAQNLSSDVLEQIRLLTNLETDKRKLLQVIMLGQPELKSMLERSELRQLAQRITARYHLEPLSEGELEGYLQYRLAVAGVERPLFGKTAIKKIYQFSGGIPRLINLICDRALLGAYAHGENVVSSRLISQAAAEVFGKSGEKKLRPVKLFTWLGFALLAVFLVGAGLFMLFPPLLPPLDVEPLPESDSVSQLEESLEEAVPSAVEDGSVNEPQVTETTENLTRTQEILTWTADVPRQQSRVMAYRALLTLWGYSITEGDALTAATQEYGLKLLEERGSLARLRQLNHPAVLQLVDDSDDPFFAVLTALDDETATLVIGTDVVRVNLTVLLRQWFGDYVLAWQPPPGYDGLIRPGSRGVDVVWLEQTLAELLEREARLAPDLQFDEVLSADVRTLQGQYGLSADGLAGPYTLILLQSLLDNDQPRLMNQLR